jgi:hypothetical protein
MSIIVHIVMFEFKSQNKEENIQTVKTLLEALPSKIPELNMIEVGIDFNQSERAFDLSLYSTFDSKEDLNAYAIHPEHLNVVATIKEVTTLSKVVDYII